MRVVGVDGGGTRTRVVLLVDGEAVSSAVGPATNPLVLGVEVAIARLLAVVDEALGASMRDAASGAASGAAREAPLDAVGVGIAGVGASASARAAIEGALQRRFATARVVVTTDVVAALAGAFEGGPGILVVGGTGSVALGYSGARCVRVGGWGRRLGDAGSGFDLFRRVACTLLAADDGLELQTAATVSLRDALVARLGLASIRDLIEVFARDPRPDEVLAAVEAIVARADAGDEVATHALHVQAQSLSELAIATQRQLGGQLAVAPTGGLILGSRIVADKFEALLQAEHIDVMPAISKPEVGAALLAAARPGQAHARLLEASAVFLR